MLILGVILCICDSTHSLRKADQLGKQYGIHSEERRTREVRDTQVIVVNRGIPAGSDLFTVASSPPDPAERFIFSTPREDDLLLDTNTGMISRGSAHLWDQEVDMEILGIDVSRIDDPKCKYNRYIC